MKRVDTTAPCNDWSQWSPIANHNEPVWCITHDHHEPFWTVNHHQPRSSIVYVQVRNIKNGWFSVARWVELWRVHREAIEMLLQNQQTSLCSIGGTFQTRKQFTVDNPLQVSIIEQIRCHLSCVDTSHMVHHRKLPEERAKWFPEPSFRSAQLSDRKAGNSEISSPTKPRVSGGGNNSPCQDCQVQ